MRIRSANSEEGDQRPGEAQRPGQRQVPGGIAQGAILQQPQVSKVKVEKVV
jgi:hypothetical protein